MTNTPHMDRAIARSIAIDLNISIAEALDLRRLAPADLRFEGTCIWCGQEIDANERAWIAFRGIGTDPLLTHKDCAGEVRDRYSAF